MRSCVERRLPALSSFLGHKPAQEMRCADVWNRDMSTPSSDTIAAAAMSLIPGCQAASFELGFVGLLADIDVILPVAEHAVDELRERRQHDYAG